MPGNASCHLRKLGKCSLALGDNAISGPFGWSLREGKIIVNSLHRGTQSNHRADANKLFEGVLSQSRTVPDCIFLIVAKFMSMGGWQIVEILSIVVMSWN